MYMERCVALEPAAASSSPVDVDFKDVFGGPPRRFSLHDVRRSFGRIDFDEVDTAAGSRSSLPGPNEKPVFGDETAKLRRYPSDDFYDDIFRGSDDSPRRSASSRNLSPSLPYKSEPFATSLPAQFSVPSMMTKAMDPPVFGSGGHSPHRYKEGTSSAYAPSTPLSRFSNEAMHPRDDGRIGVKKSNGDLLSLTVDESSFTAKTTTEKGSPTGSGQFHFSIYKWAGKGVPLLMSLHGGKSPTLQVSGKTEKSSSAKGISRSDTKFSQVSDVNVEDTEFLLVNDDFTVKNFPIEMESETMNKANAKNDIRANTMDEERTLKNTDESTKGRGEIQTSSCPEIGLSLRIEKENATVKQEMNEPKIKHPLRSLLHDEIEQGNEMIIKMAEVEENSERTPHVSNSNAGSASVKKQENRRKYVKNAETNKSNVCSPKISRENVGKTSKGKVKEFVKIFNTETPPKTNMKEIAQSQSSRLKTPGIHKTENKVSGSTTEVTDSKIPLADAKKMLDASFRVEENKKKFEKQQSAEKIIIPETRDNSSSKIDASPTSESIPIGSKVAAELIDDPFLENFQIKELSLDEDKLSKTEEELEAIRASDSKIQLWSNGRKGNIRSLLSTLQFVLWAESGWKPVALVDIIEGNAVKRAYQRAMLCLHPDKLQQKGAAAHQKYMAEKIFDILQEAWDHFNSLGSLI